MKNKDSSMAKISDRIRNRIARQVKDRGIVVWYDPAAHAFFADTITPAMKALAMR
jgi:hypothetical protein